MAKKSDDDQIPDPVDNDDVLTIDDPEDSGDGAVSQSADDGVESLKQQLDAANKAREEAERRAAERDVEARRATEESQRQRGELEDSRLQTIQNAIAAKEAQRKDLRQRLIAAKSGADYETEADLSIELAQLSTELQQLNGGKAQLENRIADEREAAKNPPQPQLPADPVERVIASTPNLTSRAANWLRSHPEVVTDPVKNAELVLADKLAQRAGIDPSSDAYFDHMDERMGYGGQQQAQPRRQSAPAAPVSRGTSIDGTRPGEIKLSRAEKEMADAWEMTYADYYKYKMAATRDTQH
jgi:hypothetical protein